MFQTKVDISQIPKFDGTYFNQHSNQRNYGEWSMRLKPYQLHPLLHKSQQGL